MRRNGRLESSTVYDECNATSSRGLNRLSRKRTALRSGAGPDVRDISARTYIFEFPKVHYLAEQKPILKMYRVPSNDSLHGF